MRVKAKNHKRLLAVPPWLALILLLGSINHAISNNIAPLISHTSLVKSSCNIQECSCNPNDCQHIIYSHKDKTGSDDKEHEHSHVLHVHAGYSNIIAYQVLELDLDIWPISHILNFPENNLFLPNDPAKSIFRPPIA